MAIALCSASGYLNQVYTLPAHRRRGLASAAVTRVLAVLAAQGLARRGPSAEASALLQKVAGFSGRQRERGAGTLVHALALKQSGQEADGRKLLADWTARDPGSALAAWANYDAQAMLTYLANSIEKADSGGPSLTIPYSLVTAIDSQPGLGPLLASAGTTPLVLAPDEMALNNWAAADLKARPGDRIRVTFYKPETTHGRLEEESAEFVLKAIVPLAEPDRPYRRNRPAEYKIRPTLANDPDLTPTVEGVTDQESIDKWEAPFPVDYDRVRPQDDEYWRNHRTTPKAFISLAAGKRLWGSRFGDIKLFYDQVRPLLELVLWPARVVIDWNSAADITGVK